MRETEEEKRARLQKNDIFLNEPYELKVKRARLRIRQWRETCWANDKDCAVSVGGLDSITLLALCRDELGSDVKGISVSVLEDISIQRVHKEMGVIRVRPMKSKPQVLQECGFPVLSKLLAAKIERLQTPGDTSPIVRAYMTGDMGAWGISGITINSSCRIHMWNCLEAYTQTCVRTWTANVQTSK